MVRAKEKIQINVQISGEEVEVFQFLEITIEGTF